jgi:hypothetical protein
MFMRAYGENIETAVEDMIEANPVAVAVRDFMEFKTFWDGTTEKLLTELSALIGEAKARRKDWPQSARGLSSKLTRSAANLRKIGIEVEHGTRTEKARPLRLIKVPARPSGPSGPSASPENHEKWHDDCHDDRHDDPNGGSHQDHHDRNPDDCHDDMSDASVSAKPPEINGNDDPDGHDDLIPPIEGWDGDDLTESADDRMAWEERAAVLQHDGGYNRSEAEKIASEEYLEGTIPKAVDGADPWVGLNIPDCLKVSNRNGGNP